jgi:hypothetical protein
MTTAGFPQLTAQALSNREVVPFLQTELTTAEMIKYASNAKISSRSQHPPNRWLFIGLVQPVIPPW